MENQQQKRVFLDFLDQQGYMEEIHGMIGRQEKRLMLNLNHLRTFDNELTTNFMRHPGEYLPAFEDALREVIVQQDPTLGKTVAMHEFRIGVEGNFGSHHVSPRELSAYLLNGLVCVEGIVTKCSLVRPKIIKSTQFCQATNRYTTRDYRDNTSLNGPATGSAMPTKDQNGNPLQVEYGMSEYMDHQMISLQEMPERAPPGQLPRSIEVLLEGDLVDQCKPGDRVALSGIHRALPSKGSTTGMFATVVLGNNLRHFSKELTQGAFHEQDIANIKRLGKRPDAIGLMATSLAPSIFGHNFEKTALLLMLLGGCEKNLANGTHLRGDINILLCGDPSTAKSQLLRFVLRIAPLAISTTGRGSSGVGLTAAVTTDEETGDRRLEAGAMVLADRGVCIIDEFDKMTDADRVAIHEVMEQQTVTISKAGIHASLNARCAVAAAANPVYGQYDPNRPPMHNIGLPDSLLSRFDLLFIVLDKKEPESDRRISKHVLSQHSQRSGPGVKPAAGSLGDPDAAKGGSAAVHPTPMFVKADGGGAAEGDDARLSTAFIKKYIHFAKMRIHPKLTEEASKRITMLYADLRAKVDDGKGRTLPVTARTLETIIRLSSAHAKAHLRNLVTVEDADAAMKLLNFAIFSEEVAAAEKRAAGEEKEAAAEDEAGGSAGGSARASVPAAREDGAAAQKAAAQPSAKAGGALVVAKARKALVLNALNTLFDSSVEEEVPKHALQQQLQSASPRFTDAELEAVLNELEEDNHIMYRDGAIHRI